MGSTTLVGFNAFDRTWSIVSFLPIPLFATAFSLIFCASNLKDYEDPLELYGMKQKALTQSFSQIIQDHGIEKVKKYEIVSKNLLQEKFLQEHQSLSFSGLVKKYSLSMLTKEELIPLKELQERFAREIQGMNLSTFLHVFSISDLLCYQIAPGDQLSQLEALLDGLREENKECSTAKEKLDSKYSKRQEALLKELDQEEEMARLDALRLKRETAADLRSSSNAPIFLDSWKNYQRIRAQNSINLEWNLIPSMERGIDYRLDREIRKIQARREEIKSRKEGESDQIRYHQELALLEKAYELKVEKLNKQFEPIQKKILRKFNF